MRRGEESERNATVERPFAYIDEVYDQQKTVIVLGHTSGSHVPASIESKPSSVLWEARLRDGLIAAWIIYYPVTPETRKRFHLS